MEFVAVIELVERKLPSTCYCLDPRCQTMDAGAATGADPDLGCPLASKSEKYSLARVSGVKRIAGEPVQNKLDRCLSTNLSAGL